MPIPTVCPSCGARLAAADGVAGRPVSCPECRTPLAADPPDDGGFEVIDSPPPVRARAKVIAVRPADSARPASVKKPTRHRDEEDDDRPRSRAKSAKSAKIGKKPLLIAGGVVVLFGLLAACGGGYWAFGESILHPAPSGWTTVSDSEGRYRIFMPGKAYSHEETYRTSDSPIRTSIKPTNPGHYCRSQGITFHVQSWPLLAGLSPPTTPEELHKMCVSSTGIGRNRETLVAVQISGRPGAELRTYTNPNWMADTPPFIVPVPDSFPPPEKQRLEAANRKKLEDHAAGQAKRDRDNQLARRLSGQHTVCYIVASEHRLYVIDATTVSEYPEEGLLKILRDSFVIR